MAATRDLTRRSMSGREPGWAGHRNPAGLLYGALITGAVIAVTSASADSARTTTRTVLEVLIAYWCAHVYIRVIADRLADPSAGLSARFRESVWHELAVLEGGVPAVAVLAVSALVGADAERAANLAMATTVALLGSAGYVVGRQAHARGWALVGEVAGASLLGLLVVALKAGLH